MCFMKPGQDIGAIRTESPVNSSLHGCTQRKALAMNKQTRFTPTSPWRELLLRLANDTARGEHFAYWFCKGTGGFKRRVAKVKTSGEISLTPFGRAIAQETAALITTEGCLSLAERPFEL